MLKLEATSFNLDPRGTLCLTVHSNALSLKADGILASIHHAPDIDQRRAVADNPSYSGTC